MKNIYKVLSCFCCIMGVLYNVQAQDKIDSLKTAVEMARTESMNKKSQKPAKPLFIVKGIGDEKGMPITFSGVYRFNANYRSLQHTYSSVKAQNLNISGFGDGTQPIGGVPMLTLNLNAKPSSDADINFALAFNHIMTGSLNPDSTRGKNIWGQTFGINTTVKTKFGKIKVGAGNQYTGMSQLFSGWSEIRWNPFYRLPWDESAKWAGSWGSYEETYNNGSGTQFNATYASGGRTQGIVMQLSELPGGFGFNTSYGVDGQTGLLITAEDSSDVVSRTKKTLGGRLYKKMNAHTFAITGILNNGYIDNISNFRETQYMYSTDANLVYSKFSVIAEIGSTAYTNPFGLYNGRTSTNVRDTIEFKSGTDFLVDLKANIKKEVFGLPLLVRVYQLGANYINQNAGAFNTSTYNNSAAYIQVNADWDVAMRKGFIVNTGQCANNRRALELATKVDKGRFKFNISTQLGADVVVDTAQNQVMFYHNVNPWSRASFNYWTPVAGPYRKLLSNYIQLLERVPITDTLVDYKKNYTVFNIDSRYKTNFLGKSMILTHYLSYQSANSSMNVAARFNNDAFVRVLYNEFLAYYQLYKNTVLVGHVGYSTAKGGNRTALSQDNGKPIHQNTWALGAGIDWNFAPNMGLYFREIWMNHKDKNFKLDHFDGFNTTVELKIFF